MKKPVRRFVNKAKSFKEAEIFDEQYYMNRTPEECVSDVQVCREHYFKMHNINADEIRKRFRRTVRVIRRKANDV